MKHIVYIASPESKHIHVFSMDQNGYLTIVQIVEIPGQGQPMAIHPQKNHLYIGVRPDCQIINYSINTQGLLTLISTTTLIGSPTHITIDKYGHNLYCASYQNSCMNVIPINKHGITQPVSQIIEGLTNCHSSAIDSINNTMWITCLTEDRIRLFSINKMGQLKPWPQDTVNVTLKSGPRHIIFHDSGHYAYIINELNSTINVFQINYNKLPNLLQTIDIMPDTFKGIRWASDIHLTPNNRWLYCCDRTASIISSFYVLDNGKKLKLLGFQETETQPRGFNIDTTGYYLIVAGQKSNHISVYSINQHNGTLRLLSRYAVGNGPIWVSIINLD